MPFESVPDELAMYDRLFYYSSDVEAVANELDSIRRESTISRELDGQLRVIILALASISRSLEQEAELNKDK